MAYIQRPIAPYPDPNPKGVGDLGADEDAEKSYTYRVSVGPMEVSNLKPKFRLKLGEFSYYHAHNLLKYERFRSNSPADPSP